MSTGQLIDVVEGMRLVARQCIADAAKSQDPYSVAFCRGQASGFNLAADSLQKVLDATAAVEMAIAADSDGYGKTKTGYSNHLPS